MPRISLIVPVYDVERYLPDCLDSILVQSERDFEVVVVDDGSPDDSVAIVERYMERDPRIRLVRQPNGGLSRARNTGVDAASGEFLAFVDSDDRLPPDAIELLVGALDHTGSDFATGNIRRFNSERTWQAQFVRKAFLRRRMRAHVTSCRFLLADRVAWNKLWRRTFWEEHGLRFPEGMYHEDIPVVIPAHHLARSVDVVAKPVYLWRQREDGGPSITQRRTEVRMLRDRLDAVESVRAFLARIDLPGAQRRYDETLVEDDLRMHIDVFDAGDGEYRAMFMDRVNAFLDSAEPGIEDRLPAIQRLKWHLVRRRLEPELLEVLRFQREELARNPRTLRGGRVYGAYPFFDDDRLRIPRAVYRLDTTRRRVRHAADVLRPSRPRTAPIRAAVPGVMHPRTEPS